MTEYGPDDPKGPHKIVAILGLYFYVLGSTTFYFYINKKILHST